MLTPPPILASSFFLSSVTPPAAAGGRSSLQTCHFPRRYPPDQPRASHNPALTFPAVPGPPRGFILRSKIAPVMRNSRSPPGKPVSLPWVHLHRAVRLSAAA